MILLACTVPLWAGALESYLIDKFSGDTTCRGCQNIAGGGESLPTVPPVFVHLVTVPLEAFQQRQLSLARQDYERQLRASFASGSPSTRT